MEGVRLHAYYCLGQKFKCSQYSRLTCSECINQGLTKARKLERNIWILCKVEAVQLRESNSFYFTTFLSRESHTRQLLSFILHCSLKWSGIHAVRLFIEHVCLAKTTEPKLVENMCRRLWTVSIWDNRFQTCNDNNLLLLLLSVSVTISSCRKLKNFKKCASFF